jgi:hypothetical protein
LAERPILNRQVPRSRRGPGAIFTRASFNGSGHPVTNREIWRFKSSRPYHFRPVVQWTGHSRPKAEVPVRLRTGRPFLRSVDRLARCPAVYRDEASSILVRSARFFGDVDKLVKSPGFQSGHRRFESRHRYQFHSSPTRCAISWYRRLRRTQSKSVSTFRYGAAGAVPIELGFDTYSVQLSDGRVCSCSTPGGADVANVIGATAMRCFMGSEKHRRTPGGIGPHMAKTIQLLRASRTAPAQGSATPEFMAHYELSLPPLVDHQFVEAQETAQFVQRKLRGGFHT